jgi:hypothetical protein
MNAAVEPRRHEPPAGWPSETFDALTDALAAALVAAVRRAEAPDANKETPRSAQQAARRACQHPGPDHRGETNGHSQA